MTKEEIIKASLKYVKLKAKEREVLYGLYTDIQAAFLAGAEFMYEHLINVWHDASEIPNKQGNLLYILPQGGLHISNIPSALRTCKLNKVRWEEYVKELGVVKWAYVNDLLPKKINE